MKIITTFVMDMNVKRKKSNMKNEPQMYEKYELIKMTYGNFDEDISSGDVWRDANEVFIIQKQYNSDVEYMTDNRDFFKEYEELVKHQQSDNPYKMKQETLCAFEENDLETMKRVFGKFQDAIKIRSVYYRVQHYGGAEEGGWYYHNMELTDYEPKDIEEGTNLYGEGYVVYEEFYKGQHENLTKEHYC